MLLTDWLCLIAPRASHRNRLVDRILRSPDARQDTTEAQLVRPQLLFNTKFIILNEIQPRLGSLDTSDRALVQLTFHAKHAGFLLKMLDFYSK